MPDVHTPISPPLRRRTQGLLRSLTMLGNAPTQSWRTDAAGSKAKPYRLPFLPR
jgi:hypothetical protein